MATYFISRHPGALDWARSVGIDAEQVAHLDPSRLLPGDRVIGTLPVHLAAEVCRRGGRYWHLVLDLPRELRGVELGRAQMEALSPALVEYRITPVDGAPSGAMPCDQPADDRGAAAGRHAG